MSIEVNNLTKFYGEQAAVNDITFSVAKGEVVGFLGPNGAGKSTTMKMITGFIPATAGLKFVEFQWMLIRWIPDVKSVIFQKTILCIWTCMFENIYNL